MWNHPFRTLPSPAPLSYEEMRRLVGYLVSTQFFEERGNPEQGEKVFARKHCGGCHDDPASGAQGRSAMAGRITSFGMVAALWEARSSDAEPHAPEKDSLASVQRLGDGRLGGIPVRLQVETTAAGGGSRPPSLIQSGCSDWWLK
jgi:hypothetical protein